MSDELNSIFFFPSPAPTNIGYIIDEGVVFEKVYERQQNSLVQVSFTKGLWPEPLHSFFYKNNFIRTRASYLTKSYEQAKNNPRLTFSNN